MLEKGKKVQINFTGIEPMKIIETEEEYLSPVEKEQRDTLGLVTKTVHAYLQASADLLKGKYHHLKELAPVHLANPGKILVVHCDDGVVIRYENSTESFKVIGASLPGGISKGALALSQELIVCSQSISSESEPEPRGIELKLFSSNPITNKKNDLLTAKIWFNATIRQPEHRSKPPQKPFCLLSVRNSLEINLTGEIHSDNVSNFEKQFTCRSFLKLPVGWECIEVYPFIDLKDWNPDYAHIWAENDILAAVATQQVHNASFQSLDPNAEARRYYGELLKQFKILLDSDPEREQTLQAFLQKYPFLICPAQTRMWPKLRLGAKETDFVFCDASKEYLLVELERSILRLFLKNGDASAELNHACGQILDWKRYIEDNLTTVQRELGLTGISANPQSLVIIGRSKDISPENRRNLVAMNNDRPKLRIMTYDDVYENAKAVIENLFGPIWEEIGSTRVYYFSTALT